MSLRKHLPIPIVLIIVFVAVSQTQLIYAQGGSVANAPKIATGQSTFVRQVVDNQVNEAHMTVAADFNGDGLLDLAATDYVDDSVFWYENNGNGGFTIRTVDANMAGAYPAHVGDVDGDGDSDLMVGGYDANTFAWYESNNAGGFTRHDIDTATSGPHSIVTVDLDEDGDVDFLTSSQPAHTIAWYENDGTQNFTRHLIDTAAFAAKRAEYGDVDGDGDVDVLAASFNSDEIAWHENDGSENFTKHIISTSANGAYYVDGADLDGDGDLDILSASKNDNTIEWYENIGGGNFTTRVIDDTARGARTVIVADMDDDGDLDAIGTSVDDDTVDWYVNDGNGNFASNPIAVSVDGAYGAFTVDIDRDGDIDVLSASRDDDSASIHYHIKAHVETVAAGGTLDIGTSQLQTVDANDGPEALIYTITSVPSGGELRLDSTPMSSGGTFTQADINNNRLSYVHGGTAKKDTFDFTVQDGGGNGIQPASGSFTILVVDPSSDVVAHLPLDEGSGDVAIDVSGSGNNGTHVNGPVYQNSSGDSSGTSLRFDGENDYLDLGTLDVNGSGLTLAVWLNADIYPSSVQDPRLITKASGNRASQHTFMLSTLEVGSDVRLFARVRVNNSTKSFTATSGNMSTGVWHHAALTYDGTTIRLYLDGAEVGSLAASGAVNVDPTSRVAVGAPPPGVGGRYFDGRLDDVRILQRAMSAAEISSLYSGNPVSNDYTLSTNIVGNGTIAVSPNQNTYANGDVVMLTATPDPGWIFSGWSGDASGTTSPLNLTMDDNKVVTATFIEDATYTLTTNSVGNGSVSKNPDLPSYQPGDSTTLNAVADPGWTFDGWSGDAAGTTTPLVVTMDSNKSITANFSQIINGPGGPTIDVWNGLSQNFGQNGNPQQWVNILGNVSDSDGVSSLVYSLNDGADRTLTIGANNRRLEDPGDFNVDIDIADLVNGANQLEIRAIDGQGNLSIETVTINYTAGQTWSMPYTIDWSTVANIQDVAQIVDGQWAIGPDGLRTTQIGYDRPIAIGDMTWTDYEVTVPIKLHNVDMADAGGVSGTPGLGILMRWQGHTDNPNPGNQPKEGWLPHGEIGWWRWKSDGTAELEFDTGFPKIPFTPAIGVQYIFKFRVESQPNLDSRYSLKVWEDGLPEPADWTMVRDNGGTNDLRTGSFLLLAHHVDASFGNVTVTSLATQPTQHTLSASTSGNGTITVAPDQPTYTVGETVTLTASPDTGWLFDSWSGDASGLANPLVLTMDSDKVVVANFVEDASYTVATTINGNGSITKNPDQPSYAVGSVVELSATAAPGWAFTEWGGDITSTSNPLNVTMDSNKNIVANFAEVSTHTVTVASSGNGIVTKEPEQPLYSIGDLVTLTASPDPGYMFTGWGGDVVGTDNPLSVTVDGDKNITAFFEPLPTYTLNVNANGNGSISLNPDQPSYQEGTIVTLTATPDSEWGFAGWGGDESGTTNPLNVVMDGNKSIIANFVSGTSLTSDDFSQCQLNTELWTIVDPVGDGSVSMADGHLLLAVPAGTLHDVWTSGNNALRTMQSTLNTDFELEVKFESAIETGIQIQGVLVEQDDDDFIRFSFNYGGGQTRLFAAHFINGSPTTKYNSSIIAAGTAPLYMRIARQGEQWTLSYSFDGQSWTQATSFTHSMTVTSSGVFAGNASRNRPAHTAVVDYFFNTASPIVPEDGAIPQHTITTSPVGNGAISLSPNQATYSCGDIVDVTAVADTGWSFVDWNGDASGTDNPVSIVVDGDKNVVANFQKQGPDINVWGGSTQNFGQLGHPQQWVNILGNVTDSDGVATLAYSLNGGSEQQLSIGPDNRRLELPGDFNIDIDRVNLVDGANQIAIRAVDGAGNEIIEMVTVNYIGGTVWPLPYAIDWGTVTSVVDAAQIVDGQWTIDSNGIRPAQIGYDRFIAIGDLGWTDYEVTVPIVIHSVDQAGAGGVSGTPGLGIVMRWQGHTDDPLPGMQPKSGWLPHGEIGWLRWKVDNTAELKFETGLPKTDFSPVIGTRYMFKMKVETLPSLDSRYSLKVWEDGQPEPYAWNIQRDNGGANDLSTGSLLLLAHHVDVSFGNVSVEPVTQGYSVTTNVAGNGSVTKTPSQTTYNTGDIVWLAATPQTGSVFTGWSGDATGVENPVPIVVNADRNVTANFVQLTTHTVTTNVTGNGTIILNPEQPSYNLGDVLTLTAVPNTSWEFTGWSGDVSGTVNPLTITIDGDKNIVARFVESQTFTLSTSVSGNGQVAADPSQDSYSAGAAVTLTATPDAGWEFTGWSGDVAAAENPLSITMDSNKNVIATFAEIVTYSLTTNANGNGSVNVEPAQSEFQAGAIATLTANPDAGWVFVGWSGDVTVTDNPLTFTMDSSKSVTAEFVQAQIFALTTSVNGNGSVTLNPNQTQFSEGDTVTLTAVPDTGGWIFTGWDGDASGTQNPLTVTMDSDKNITANFYFGAAFESDHFSECSLAQFWTVVDPAGLGSVTLPGTDQIELTIPTGANYNVWTGGNRSLRIMQPAVNSDFETEVKFESALEQGIQMQGLLFEEDASNFMRVDFTYSAGKTNLFAAKFVNGSPTTVHNVVIADAGQSPLYLRVLRQGDDWTPSYSFDGQTWIQEPSFAHALNVANVGVFVGNASQSRPDHTAVVDYFFNTAIPAQAGNPIGLTLNTVGAGTIIPDPDQGSYNCGDAVSLTAVPDADWQFSNWSDDASGSVNPLSITLDGDLSVTANFVGSGPAIDVWDGLTQNFGQLGDPQQYINILGNVSDSNGVATLVYSLNGGSEQTLSIGPDNRRLEYAGDFNIDLDIGDLVNGANQLLIQAVDNSGIESSAVVTLNYSSGNQWPLPYSIEWTGVSGVSDVVQIVDGKWAIEANGLRTAEVGYDRLAAIGDMGWTDYEVTVPVLIHDVDFAGAGGVSGEPGLGILMRWHGHTDEPLPGMQPKTGWIPHGEIGWWRWNSDGSANMTFGTAIPKIPFTPVVGTQYIFKMRVETLPDGKSRYSIKAWEASQAEPTEWTAQRDNGGSNDLTTGSFMLLAHHVDVTFGAVDVVPITSVSYTLSTSVVGNGNVVASPAQATYLEGSAVSLIPVPDIGWGFTGWSGDATGLNDPLSVVMDADKNITANFAELQTFTLAVDSLGDGTITVSPDEPTYQEGDSVTLTATPNSGSAFGQWSGDVASTTNPLTIVMDSNKSIIGEFINVTPDIQVWFGSNQSFGQLGNPQMWINILGNVTDQDGGTISSLVYSLNGGAERSLSIGPDNRRLEYQGDFNIDIATSELQNGANQIVITATDNDSNVTTETVAVDYTGSQAWPLPYTLDWGTASAVDDMAQIVDGNWTIGSDGLRTSQPGYDRAVAIGDVSWTDYEVTVPILIHTVDFAGAGGVSGTPGLGLLMRWQGHTDDPLPGMQPKSGWLPHGEIGWWRWQSDGTAELEFATGQPKVPFTPVIGTLYIFKMQVESLENGDSRYSIKVWEDGQQEPADWVIQRDNGGTNDLSTGSFMLLAHHVDASFGNVVVQPLTTAISYSLTTNTNGNGTLTIDPDQASYNPGDVLTLTAAADNGWTFTGWSGDAQGLDNPLTITMDDDKSIAANFTQDAASYTLSTNVTGGGSITVDPDLPEYNAGDLVTLTATPGNGESFTGWGGDAAGLDNPISITMDADKTVIANFGTPTTIVSDDFSTCALDSGLWTYVDPVGDGSLTMTGTALAIGVPAGTKHDVWTNGNESVRVMQPANDTDFVIEVKFESAIDQAYKLQGLIIEQDDTNFLRFDFFGTASTTRLFAAWFVDGSPSARYNKSVASAGQVPLYLRVERSGDVWTQFYSFDGLDWTQGANFSHSLTVTSVGIFVGNSGGSNPAHTAIVDYFSNSAAPIANEDGNVEQPALVTNTSGNGSVSVIPTQSVYSCGDSVTLTATPDQDWVFEGWSGDELSTSNPLVITMDGSKSLTATFTETVDAASVDVEQPDTQPSNLPIFLPIITME